MMNVMIVKASVMDPIHERSVDTICSGCSSLKICIFWKHCFHGNLKDAFRISNVVGEGREFTLNRNKM